MAVTRLERKGRKNKTKAKNRVATISRLNARPVISKIDIEAIKKEFASKASKQKKADAELPPQEVSEKETSEKAQPKLKKEAKKPEKKGSEESPKKS